VGIILLNMKTKSMEFVLAGKRSIPTLEDSAAGAAVRVHNVSELASSYQIKVGSKTLNPGDKADAKCGDEIESVGPFARVAIFQK
jgi:hypothetical protein